jgi:anaerobic dimethyl sulfoxide reductase subunit C (anchor subunit)
MIFTLFICLGAGTFGIAGLLAGLNKAPEIQMPATAISLVAIIIGGIASFLHLQHWDRIFNGFGHITSGITQELIGIVIFVVVAVIYFIMLRRRTVPTALGWVALIVSVALVIVASLSYAMSARPVWDTPLLWLYYLANALLFGSLVVALLAAYKKLALPLLSTLVLAGAALTLVAAVGYAIYIPSVAPSFTSVGNYFDPTHPTKVMADPAGALSGFMTGGQALLFWAGVVIAGSVVPIIIAFASKKVKDGAYLGLASLSCVCALAGGICFRVIFYALGFSVFVFY